MPEALAETGKRPFVKICGLTREQDVDAAVAAGADAVGFVLYAPSPRAVTPERAAQLARRLPPFVTPVLLFVNESAINIAAASAMVEAVDVLDKGPDAPPGPLELAPSPRPPAEGAAQQPVRGLAGGGEQGGAGDNRHHALDAG